jgi:hypothetical protein
VEFSFSTPHPRCKMTKVRFVHDTTIYYGPQRVFKDQEMELPPYVAEAVINSGDAVSIDPAFVVVAEEPLTIPVRKRRASKKSE